MIQTNLLNRTTKAELLAYLITANEALELYHIQHEYLGEKGNPGKGNIIRDLGNQFNCSDPTIAKAHELRNKTARQVRLLLSK